MSSLFDLIEKYKFGIIAVLATYVAVFMYLQMQTVPRYYEFEPFFEDPMLEVPEEIEIKAEENIDVTEFNQSSEVKNAVRDLNDKRTQSNENYGLKKSAEEVEQEVREMEKRMFEATGQAEKRAELEKLRKEREEKNKQNTKVEPTNSSNIKNSPNAVSGQTMVSYELANRSPFQNKEYWVRNPGYTCKDGSNGLIIIQVKVNRNGNVTAASVFSQTSNTNECMLDQALKYAKLSRFNYSSSAEESQVGYIKYQFISQ
jgi:outer membrane biosynthesis protein TonB